MLVEDNEGSSKVDPAKAPPAPAIDAAATQSHEPGPGRSAAFDNPFGSTARITGGMDPTKIFGSTARIAIDSTKPFNFGSTARIAIDSTKLFDFGSTARITGGMDPTKIFGSSARIAIDSTKLFGDLDAAFSAIVRSLEADAGLADPLTSAEGLACQPDGSTLDLASPHQLVLPCEAAAEAHARDFLSGFRLAVAWMQTQGEVASRNILRAATSTPSKVAGLSAAVALVFWLSGPSWNDPGDVIDQLADALGLVGGPFAIYEWAKFQKRG